MIFYRASSGNLPHIMLMGRETFENNSSHKTRVLSETVLYYLTDGSLELESGGEKVTLLPGDIHIFGKGEYQKPLKKTACRYYYIHLFDTLEETILGEEQAKKYFSASKQFFLLTDLYSGDIPETEYTFLMLPKHFNIKASSYSKEIKNCFSSKLNSFTAKTEHYNMLYRLNTARLFYYLHNSYSENIFNTSMGFNESTVNKIVEYIDKNIGEHITGARLEEVFGYSFDHMNRRFKEITGQTVFSYIKTVKINNAKRLLYTKDISIGEVAELTGFCDIYHFSKTFKDYAGITPSEYMKAVESRKA